MICTCTTDQTCKVHRFSYMAPDFDLELKIIRRYYISAPTQSMRLSLYADDRIKELEAQLQLSAGVIEAAKKIESWSRHDKEMCSYMVAQDIIRNVFHELKALASFDTPASESDNN